MDYQGLRYGGNGTYDVTAPVAFVSNYGCNEQDYAQFPSEFALVYLSHALALESRANQGEKS